jgi:DNA polymerase-3 subunit delta'
MGSLEELLGQARAVRPLRAAVESGRPHHAFLFAGPHGVGKCTAALGFARILLCQGRPAERFEACGACRSCTLWAQGETEALDPTAWPHPDLHVVTKELARFSANRELRDRKLTAIPVDLLRERVVGGRTGDGRFCEAPAHKSSQLGGARVFVLDQAEWLEEAAQNALLKTLEEPPAGTHLILVTAAEHKLLPTIRSRCERVGFARLSDEALRAWLARQEAAPEEDAQAALWRFADGSPGRLALAQRYGLRSWQETLRPAMEQMRAGRYPARLGGQLKQMIENFASARVQESENASKDAANREAAGLLLAMVAAELRTGLAQAAEAAPVGDPLAGERTCLPWLRALDAVERAEHELAGNTNLTLVAEHLVAGVHEALAEEKQASA